MSGSNGDEALRRTAREVIRELLPGMLDEVLDTEAGGGAGALPVRNGHNGHSGHSGHNGRSGPNGHNGHNRHNGPSEHTGYSARHGHPPAAEQVIPLVPAPPVAAVLRPSTWSGPPVPGEVVGEGSAPAAPAAPAAPPAPAAPTPPAVPPRAATPPPAVPPTPEPVPGQAEPVVIDSDEDLDRFVRALVTRMENPRDRRALRTGRIRFTLRRTGAPASSASAMPVVRLGKGAVTERAVREAAAAGARIVLERGAVLTPLARDKARAMRVQIERER